MTAPKACPEAIDLMPTMLDWRGADVLASR
jgi:hypothetical protein